MRTPQERCETDTNTEIAALRSELLAMASRVDSLHASLARAEERFDAFTSTLPGISWETWGRPDEACASYVSPSVLPITGYTQDEWMCQPGFWLDLVLAEQREQAKQEVIDIALSDATQGIQEYPWKLKNGKTAWAHVRYSIVRDETGAPIVWQAFTLDVTAQKSAEAERDALLESQSALLLQLSTPLIPISEHVVAMPLIGPLDQGRADRAIEVLLNGLATMGSRFAILDVTGVPTIDRQVVDALTRAARATRLVGAEVMLTGVRADVAQAFCAHGEYLNGITTCATLQQGIARAFQKTQGRRSRALSL